MKYIMDICGTPMDIETIKKYRLQKVSYLFRPVFREQPRGLLQTKYVATTPEPYGMIVDQESRKSFLEFYRPKSTGEAVIMELSHGIIGKVAEKFNWNNIKMHQLSIMGISGAIFQKRFDEIPAKLIKADGQVLDFFKDDPVHKQLENRAINPEIRIIDSLWILTGDNEAYSFFDSGVHTWDLRSIYDKLNETIIQLNQQKEEQKAVSGPRVKQKSDNPKVQIPHIKMPEVKLPDVKLPNISINIGSSKKGKTGR